MIGVCGVKINYNIAVFVMENVFCSPFNICTSFYIFYCNMIIFRAFHMKKQMDNTYFSWKVGLFKKKLLMWPWYKTRDIYGTIIILNQNIGKAL